MVSLCCIVMSVLELVSNCNSEETLWPTNMTTKASYSWHAQADYWSIKHTWTQSHTQRRTNYKAHTQVFSQCKVPLSVASSPDIPSLIAHDCLSGFDLCLSPGFWIESCLLLSMIVTVLAMPLCEIRVVNNCSLVLMGITKIQQTRTLLRTLKNTKEPLKKHFSNSVVKRT